MTTLPERLLEIIDMQLRLNLLLPADAPNSRGCNARLRELQDALEAAQALQAAPEGGGVDHYSISWADYWIGQGNFPLANDFETFELANAWLQANRTASPTHPAAALQAGEA